MSQITVDNFVIEMSLQENVLKGLQKLEKQILPIASRMEKTINKTFSRDYNKSMNKTFSNIEKRAQQASRNINRSLTQAFNVGSANSGMFNRYRQEGQAAARDVGRAIRDSYRIRGQSNPPLPPLPRSGQSRSRSNPRQVIEDIHQRQLTSVFYGQMQLRETTRAAEYRSRLERLRMEHTASQDARGFRNSLRSLNYEFAQTQRLASQQRDTARLNAMRASNAGDGLSRLTDGATGLLVGFFALHKAMTFFQESVQTGAKIQQSRVMALTAYGDEREAQRMTVKADEVANSYGLDLVQTREQMAQMRMTMPDQFSNDKLAKLFENESIFAHTTGMSPDAVGRLNYAFQQIATSAHLMGQDFLQVVNASPALVKGLQKLHGFTNSSQLKEYYKTVPGSKFVEDSLRVMTPTDQQKKLAQENILAVQGRLSNSYKMAQGQFFSGFEHSLSRFYDTLSENLDNSSSALRNFGKASGFFIDRLNDISAQTNQIATNVTGYTGLASEKWVAFFKGLSPEAQSHLDKVGGIITEWLDWLIVVVTARLAIAGAAKVGKMAGIGSISGVMGAAGRTFGIAAAIILGKELGDLVFDTWIPAFDKYAHDRWGWGGKDGNETTHGGNTIKDSPVDKALNWMEGMINMVKQAPLPSATGYPAYSGEIANRAAYLPPAQRSITFAPLKLEIINSGALNVTMPDGSIQKVALDAVQQQHEFQMMSAQGLQGSWQGTGDNAGFSPSSLMR